MTVRKKPRLYNVRHGDAPEGAVNIMRGTPWGNGHRIRPGVSREMAVVLYIDEKSKDERFLTRVRTVLHGRDLVCCCAPRLCHGEWLLKVANPKEKI